ncbi:hypothetical protein SLS57_012349 [Botryosphaeria dothidea]
MVLVKRICSPERRKATIAVSATLSSATLSTHASPEGQEPEPFQLRISLHIAASTRPAQAITIRTDGTVFAPSHPAGALDTLARGTASLASTSDPARGISLGRFFAHRARQPDEPPDLRQRPATHLLTIPAAGAVDVVHALPLDRVFRHEDQLAAEDVVGETWRLRLNDGFVGTTWWCWGALEGELREKRLSPWHEGMRSEITPKPDVGDEWVLGSDPAELVFEDRTADSSFRFV